MKLGKAIAAAVLAVATTCAFADALTDRARQLLRGGQHKQAYDLLLPQEPARAGDPEFDYLLGIAALDAGDPERAIFALERVLAMQPSNHVARAEIARAYLAVGEKEAARREFQTVRAQSIPADAQATIDKYLSAIAAADVTQIRGYFELGFGYDSNINSATSDSQIAIPSLGNIIAVLDPDAQRKDALLSAISGGVSVTHRLSKDFAFVGGVGASGRIYPAENSFDQFTADGNAGLRLESGKEAFTVGLQAQHFAVGGERFRQAHGVIAQWQHTYNERRQATLYGQFTELHYPHQTIRDADRTVIGAAFGSSLGSSDTAPVVFLSAYGGQEEEQADGVPHLGHDLAGVRVGGQVRLGTGLAAFANASYEKREYGGPEPLFLEEREDEQSDLTLGISYLVRPSTTFIAQVAHTENQSNIPINDFDRTVFSFALRVNF